MKRRRSILLAFATAVTTIAVVESPIACAGAGIGRRRMPAHQRPDEPQHRRRACWPGTVRVRSSKTVQIGSGNMPTGTQPIAQLARMLASSTASNGSRNSIREHRKHRQRRSTSTVPSRSCSTSPRTTRSTAAPIRSMRGIRCTPGNAHDGDRVRRRRVTEPRRRRRRRCGRMRPGCPRTVGGHPIRGTRRSTRTSASLMAGCRTQQSRRGATQGEQRASRRLINVP